MTTFEYQELRESVENVVSSIPRRYREDRGSFLRSLLHIQNYTLLAKELAQLAYDLSQDLQH